LLCWYEVGVERKSRSPVSTNLELSAALVAAFAVVVAVFFYAGRSNSQAGADGGSDGGVQVVREDGHRLGEPGAGDVTLLCLGDSAENASSSTMPCEPRRPVGKDA
jgi:hypothetical protein